MPNFTTKHWCDPTPDYSNPARVNILTDCGYLVASVLGRENAEHILACVRACNGLSEEELKTLGAGGLKVLMSSSRFLDRGAVERVGGGA